MSEQPIPAPESEQEQPERKPQKKRDWRAQPRAQFPCSIPGCGKRCISRGLCSTHYCRWWKYGDPLALRGPSVLQEVHERFWSSVDRAEPDRCWEWQGSTNEDGYGEFGMDRKIHRAHRIAYTFAIGIIPDRLQVLHRCDNPPCCNPAHLFLGTQQENIADMHAKGRYRGNTKIDIETANVIRERRANGETVADLAAEYHVHQETIRRIARVKR